MSDTNQTARRPLGRQFCIGDVVLHPDGRVVQIVGGQYEVNGRISNHWTWREVLPGGFLANIQEHGYGWQANLPPERTKDEIADEALVRDFAIAMGAKLARKRQEGRGGWWECPEDELWRMLREHVEKGDPVDIANFAMMIHGVRRLVNG